MTAAFSPSPDVSSAVRQLGQREEDLTRHQRVYSIASTVASITLLLVAVAAVAHAAHGSGSMQKHRIVYQLSDPGVDKAKFVLGNIRNHINGVGWDRIEAIELVVFGPALRTFVTADLDPSVKLALEQLQTQGLTLGVCGNTMRNLNLTLEQLPEGARLLPQGGVVRLMELQEQGYINIRP